MWPTTERHGDRDLDFFGLLGELHALIGERVTVEAAGRGQPVALEARGTLAHLSDLQLTFGRPINGPAVLVLGLEEANVCLWLREKELMSARAFDIEGPDGLGPARHLQIVLRGGVELLVGLDVLDASLEG